MYWTSPPKGSGCIDFKAMIIERQDYWYMDDGELTYSMCEDDAPLAEPTVRFFFFLRFFFEIFFLENVLIFPTLYLGSGTLLCL